MTSQYAQIGNAVPVNLAYAVGIELVRTLNAYVTLNPMPQVAFKAQASICNNGFTMQSASMVQALELV
jgi:hypothetical protein